MEGTLYIDGVLCDTHIIPEATSFPEDKWSIANIGFIQVSPTSRRNFVFADVSALGEFHRVLGLLGVAGARYITLSVTV